MAHSKKHVKNDSLSNTSHGKFWLSQFDESDRAAARLLLDSILYVSNDQLIAGLYDLINKGVKGSSLLLTHN